MAAPDSFGPTRTGYLALYNALLSLRTNELDRHISRGSFYTQPLPVLIRDMQLLIQAKDPNRKFPQSMRKEDVPQYFKSLLREMNSASEHDFFGHIERGLRDNNWGNIPVPRGETPPTPPPAVPLPSEAEKSEKVEETQVKKVEKHESVEEKRIGSSSSQGQVRPSGKETPSSPPPQSLAEKPTVNVQKVIDTKPHLPHQGIISSVHIPQRTLGQSGYDQKSVTRKPVSAQGQSRPSRIIRGMKIPGPVKDLGSQAAVQLIRHPVAPARIIMTSLGALGGYALGGAPGAGVGALLGGLIGPNILSSGTSLITGGRSGGNPPSGNGGSGQGNGGYIGNQARNMASRAASNAARRVALLAARGSVSFFAANAWWIVLIIVIGIILLLVLMMMLCILPWSGCDGGLNGGSISKNITLQKTAPQQVDNGVTIEYKIEITNKGSQNATATVIDDLPENTVYVTGNNDPSTDQNTTKRIQWTINDLGPGQKKDLNFTVIPQGTDTWVVNRAVANVRLIGGGTSGNVNIPGNIPPTKDNCNGTYPLSNPIGNFGDPECNFKKEALHQLLKQQDPTHADYWFVTVARCESNYSPNAYADPVAVGTPDPIGAWGLFQMGRGKNGEFDHGDVIWQLQTSNAVNYNNNITKIGLAWRYWQCANDRW